MRHTIEVKLPKLFGKKKTNNETEVKTEVDMEDHTVKVSLGLAFAAPLVVGVTAAYLVGYNKGLVRGIDKGTGIVVVK